MNEPVLDFLQVLWRVNHAMERRSRRMLQTLGVTAPQRMVLRFVGTSPGISPGELAATLHIDPGTLSSTLRRLEANGLLSRVTDPVDGRRVRVYLTARGERLNADIPETVEAAVRAMLAQIPREKAATGRQTLEMLAVELERMPPRRRQARNGRSLDVR